MARSCKIDVSEIMEACGKTDQKQTDVFCCTTSKNFGYTHDELAPTG
jgi:hypothetical protein